MSHDPLYITVEEIKTAVGIKMLNETIPMTDPASGIASPAFPGLAADTEKIGDIIESVCDEIDSYLGSVATVPITGTIPGTIKKIAEILTIGYIYQDESGIPASESNDKAKAYSDLEKIQNGEMYCNGLSYLHNGVTVVNGLSTDSRGTYTAPKFSMSWVG